MHFESFGFGSRFTDLLFAVAVASFSSYPSVTRPFLIFTVDRLFSALVSASTTSCQHQSLMELTDTQALHPLLLYSAFSRRPHPRQASIQYRKDDRSSYEYSRYSPPRPSHPFCTGMTTVVDTNPHATRLLVPIAANHPVRTQSSSPTSRPIYSKSHLLLQHSCSMQTLV